MKPQIKIIPRENYLEVFLLDSNIVHGVNCPKAPHTRTGYLHDEADDAPYDVDGLWYCGRCHMGLDK